MSEETRKVPVNAEALRSVLLALNGPGHLIRELQATRAKPPIFQMNEIDVLISEFNAWVESQVDSPEPANGPTMNKWTPTTNLLELRRLGKTVEELGEQVAVLGRTVCQGLQGVDPASGENNIERITKESADVLAQIECNIEAFKLDRAKISDRVAYKKALMAEWEALFK